MIRVVAKFGGSSVGTIERIRHAAGLVAEAVARGETHAVVVSAMAGETDRLLGLAGEFGAGLGDAETDVALAAGEQVAAALMALALRERGLQSRSFLGWQAPVFTDGPPGAARIAGMEASAFEAAMAAGIVPVLAGYQGIAEDGCLRTLGRGGTDLSAAALAAALGARCDIYTDVDGVYTTDPRIEPAARRLDAISHDEMLELAAQGAKVLQARSVEFAKSRHVPMRVLSSFLAAGQSRGTDIVADRDIAERRVVSGVAYARDQARIAVLGGAPQSRFASETFAILANAGIGVDMIVQAHGREPDTVNLEFSVAHRDLDRAQSALEQGLPGLRIGSETGLAKVSVVGAGLRQRADVARSLFGVLGESGIAVKVLATSEIKISALIDNDAVERAVRALHAAYGLDRMGN
ncbi:aspartate kinase [Maricaulis salignorans]|uniref:Aspartokinase n=1 Tax=Maricaulis salignorans TaxID=144026 RepID=A0A1G9N4K8_9PROT|nr:aspartate kinase [Maricaulis salignorans]SDL81418.1 aspartate kinase [Maricaulis salignorans]